MEAPLLGQFVVEHTERMIYWQFCNTHHISTKAHTSKDILTIVTTFKLCLRVEFYEFY